MRPSGTCHLAYRKTVIIITNLLATETVGISTFSTGQLKTNKKTTLTNGCEATAGELKTPSTYKRILGSEKGNGRSKETLNQWKAYANNDLPVN